MGIVTGDIILQVTMSCKYFLKVPDILTCQGWKILIIVEGCQPHCCSCSAVEHVSKACTEKNMSSQPCLITAMTEVGEEEKSDRDPKG